MSTPDFPFKLLQQIARELCDPEELASRNQRREKRKSYNDLQTNLTSKATDK
jgi:hypothetical protein